MKKLVMAIELAALIAMFPVYMIVELNHGKVRVHTNNTATEIKEQSEINHIKTIDNN